MQVHESKECSIYLLYLLVCMLHYINKSIFSLICYMYFSPFFCNPSLWPLENVNTLMVVICQCLHIEVTKYTFHIWIVNAMPIIWQNTQLLYIWKLKHHYNEIIHTFSVFKCLHVIWNHRLNALNSYKHTRKQDLIGSLQNLVLFFSSVHYISNYIW